MQITIFSVAMMVLWSSLLVVIVSILRSDYRYMDLYSIPGILMLYMFCVIRMFVPIEFPWVRMVFWEKPYNLLVKFLYTEIDAGFFGTLIIEQFVLLIWIGGSILFLVKLAIGYLWANGRVLQLSYSEDEYLNGILAAVEEKYGRKLKVKIARCYGIDVPYCIGIIQKKILIPDIEYGEKQMYSIVLHEYTHVWNHDQVNRFLVNLLCCIYWWNPFIYLLRKDLEFYLECHCDQVAIQDMDDEQVAEYVNGIMAVLKVRMNIGTDISERQGSRRRGIGHGDVKKRCWLIKDGFYDRQHVQGMKVMPVLMAVILVLSYSFSFHANISPEKEDIEYSVKDSQLETYNSYILHRKDDTYVLVSPNDDPVVISEEGAERMQKDGFIVKDEVD